MRLRMLLACAGLALGVTTLTSTVQAAEGWKLSGYTQIRYNLWDEDLDDRSFDFRRVYLKAEGPVGHETTVKVQIDLSGVDDGDANIKFKEALITRKLDADVSGAFGFTSLPFGFEVPTSNSRLLPFERSEVSRRFFPGERATGLWLAYHPGPQGRRVKPQFNLGCTSGITKWYGQDAAGDKDDESYAFFGRAQLPIVGSSGVVGVSYMAARRERTIGGVDTSFGAENVFGAHVRYDSDLGFAVQGDYYTGEILDENTSGWYGQAEYRLPRRPCTLFYRYDTCDRAGKPIDFERHTAGIAWERGKSERVTLQVEAIDGYKYGANSITNWGVQYQIKY